LANEKRYSFPPFYNLPAHTALNSAARLAFTASRYDRITPLQTQLLHWLKVPERIKFKLPVPAYRCLQQTTPPFLA